MAWPRILPKDGQVNQQGLEFYERIIDECHAPRPKSVCHALSLGFAAILGKTKGVGSTVKPPTNLPNTQGSEWLLRQ
ncbi:Beta-glucosidase [Vibrio vulnificus]|nr:Beta-glucosidase [Vibrio vulnificus]